MLPKQNKLKKKEDFERVFKEGKGQKEDFLFLKIAKNNLGISRFAVIVGKKVSKKATVRNKLKRKIYALLREKLKDLKEGIDGIFVALPGAEKKEFSELKKTIEKLFKKAKVFKYGITH